MENPIYNGLSGEQMKKVVSVQGDVTLPELGITRQVSCLLLFFIASFAT